MTLQAWEGREAGGVTVTSWASAAIETYLPPEWSPHAATWISWPRPDGISFPGKEEQARLIWIRLVETIAQFEPIHINVPLSDEWRWLRGELMKRGLLQGCRVQLHPIPTDEPWIRDHGPLFVLDRNARGCQSLAILDPRFNAWGEKYAHWQADDAVPRRVAELLRCKRIEVPAVLEGGAIETNGEGLLIASSSTLLNANRNPGWDEQSLGRLLCRYLGAQHVIWLDLSQLDADDTDGHVDQIVRFVNPRTLLVAEPHESDKVQREVADAVARHVQEAAAACHTAVEVVRVPLPPPVYQDGLKLPTSYLNFYIVNGGVVVPTFDEPQDEKALSIISRFFPERRIVPFPARDLIWGLGAVHCATQQQPLAE